MVTTLELLAVLMRLNCEPDLPLGDLLASLEKPGAITPTLICEMYFAYASLDIYDLYALAAMAALENSHDPDQQHWMLVVEALFKSAQHRD